MNMVLKICKCNTIRLYVFNYAVKNIFFPNSKTTQNKTKNSTSRKFDSNITILQEDMCVIDKALLRPVWLQNYAKVNKTDRKYHTL